MLLRINTTKTEKRTVPPGAVFLFAVLLLEQQIRDLQPRISDLLALTNQCRELNIPFPNAVQTGKFYGNGKHNFFSDGFYHELGFMGYPFNYIQFLGYDMGGFCGTYDFFTDGAMIFLNTKKQKK